MNSILSYLVGLTRRDKIIVQASADLLLIVACFVAAMVIRLESLQFFARPGIFSALLITAPATLISFHLLGLYRSLTRHITGSALIIIAKGTFLSVLFLYAASAITQAQIPRSVPIIYGLCLFLTVGGLRFIVRRLARQTQMMLRKPAIIYGAGAAGVELLNTLFHNRDYEAVAFVDDDPTLQGLTISGVQVYAPDRIPQIMSQTGTRVMLLALPSITRKQRRAIIESLDGIKIEVKSTPSLSDVISGKAKLSDLHTVTPEDMLGRDPVAPDTALMEQNVSGKVVMVSGAGGSIGSELCRQLLTLSPATLILFEVSEHALYDIDMQLSELAQNTGSSVEIVPVLGSVQNAQRLGSVIASLGVQTVFHAAAYKHVPLVEENVIEAVRNNIFGTLTISSVAQEHGVENFILISTDKAVRPTNVMGATKRVAELICQARSKNSASTVFSMVRFGNVLGSSGSVIPRFREQIERGGPVTVTHPEMTRYFMTIPEAAQLVIQAGSMSKGGSVFVLDMGQPVKIMDLAFSMVKLNGLVPYLVDSPDERHPDRGDIPVCVTGLRKGEKLYEELLIGNNPTPTSHPRIMSASEVSVSCSELRPALDRLISVCEGFDVPGVLDVLKELPIDYRPLDH